MRLVLATSNQGKIREIKARCTAFDVVAYSDLIHLGDIVEDGSTFAENALIKAKTVYDALADPDAIVLSDDSGISVDVLDGAPGIYSARYAAENATDKDNLRKMVDTLKANAADTSQAYYTAAISIVCREGTYTVHGWLHGHVITSPRGDRGFGYDPIFIPEGHDKTLGELPPETKRTMSHRSRALSLAMVVLGAISHHRLRQN